jgi:hypothetical protein
MSRLFDKPLAVTSPHLRGKRVRAAQFLLSKNRFKRDFLKGRIDGVWDPVSGHSADQARWELGYPKSKVNTGKFGNSLYDFLRTDGKAKRLSPLMVARRKVRLAELKRRRNKKYLALQIARSQVGINESPPYSNRCKFSYWYGYIGPWCAMFTEYCLVKAGIIKGARSALAYWYEWMGRARRHGMSITNDPEPGDIVVFHISQGHVGFFDHWINRSRGDFATVEGNTSLSSDDDGGEVMRRTRNRYRHNAVFVRIGV